MIDENLPSDREEPYSEGGDKAPHYGIKPRYFETSNYSLSHAHRSVWVSEQANEWPQRSELAKQARQRKRMSERFERTSVQANGRASGPVLMSQFRLFWTTVQGAALKQVSDKRARLWWIGCSLRNISAIVGELRTSIFQMRSHISIARWVRPSHHPSPFT